VNVLHVIPAVAARYGGPSHAVAGMTRALAYQGIDVLIATTDADGPRRVCVPCGSTLVWQGVPTIFFRRQWSEAFKYSGPLAHWLAKHVAEFNVVHVHAVFSHACLAAAFACRRKQVPYIVRPLGTLDPWSLKQKPLRKQLLWYGGARWMLDGAAAIHYTTLSEQRLAEVPLHLRHGVVIPLGVDAELFNETDRADLASGDPYVLILGRLHPKKGLELFIDIFAQLVRESEFAHWRLVIAGDGDPSYVASLKDHICERGLTRSVVLPGWLGGDAKAAALRGAALLALPSHQENFGIVVAEGLACGTPVLVSTNVNLADEIRAGTAGWITSLEPHSLLETLTEALRNGEERERRGAAGRALALSHFTWPTVAEALGQLYSRVQRN
jgi:glycosyltransferase involved in cell wall biosynthesis